MSNYSHIKIHWTESNLSLNPPSEFQPTPLIQKWSIRLANFHLNPSNSCAPRGWDWGNSVNQTMKFNNYRPSFPAIASVLGRFDTKSWKRDQADGFHPPSVPRSIKIQAMPLSSSSSRPNQESTDCWVTISQSGKFYSQSHLFHFRKGEASAINLKRVWLVLGLLKSVLCLHLSATLLTLIS